MDIIVLAFSNNDNKAVFNLKKSLHKYGYNYEIIGAGIKWESFMTKIKGYYNYISKLDDKKIVCIIDAYDILACDRPENLKEKFLSFQSNIVVGAENTCTINCKPLDEHFNKSKNVKNIYEYVNSGFCIGYAKNMVHMLKYVLDLNIKDDQIGVGKYMNEYYDNICLDGKGSIVSNINLSGTVFHTIWKNNKVYNINTKENPCFIHTPGIDFDLHWRMDYFGNKILGEEYEKISMSEKYNGFYKKVKSWLGDLVNYLW
jgi:hypothetical protein